MEDFAITSSRVSSANSTLSTPSFSQREVHQQQVTQSRSQHGQRERHNHQHHRRRHHHTRFALHRLHPSVVQLVPANLRHEACSTFLVLLSFWILACTTVVLGFYGPSTIQFGPNCSRLIRPNPFFVQSIKVKEIRESIPGSMLYGFAELPPLDVPVTLSEVHDVSVQSNDHKEWPFFLNQGSKIHISYIVKRPSSAALSLVIAEGNESLAEWIEDPSYANTTLSWNIIHENGTFEQEICRSALYYIAMRNLNLEEVEVQLNYTIVSIMYNTSQAQYNCSLSHNLCTFTLYLLGSNAAVLTSPSAVQNTTSNYKWFAHLSYGQRWMSYIVGAVSSSVLVLVLLQLLSAYQISRGHAAGFAAGRTSETERAPLIASDDDEDLSSCDSSNDSTSHDEEYMTESLAESKLDGKQLEEKEKTDNNRRLCIICLDALRNCFFLPCGHCAACFTCGTRIIEEAGDCPTCHKAVKKARKIFSV